MSEQEKKPIFKARRKMHKLESVKEEHEENENEEGKKEPSSPPSICPGILGPDSPYVRLVSANDHEFFIRRELAEKSVTIRSMLHVPGGNNHDSTVYLQMISPRALHCICAYLRYQKLYLDRKGEVDPFEIEPDLALELVLAASFLDI